MSPLAYWTAVLNLSGYWRAYHKRLEQEGPIDWRTYQYISGPFAGRPVEQVAQDLGLSPPAECVLHHPFGIFRKERS